MRAERLLETGVAGLLEATCGLSSSGRRSKQENIVLAIGAAEVGAVRWQYGCCGHLGAANLGSAELRRAVWDCMGLQAPASLALPAPCQWQPPSQSHCDGKDTVAYAKHPLPAPTGACGVAGAEGGVSRTRRGGSRWAWDPGRMSAFYFKHDWQPPE